MNNGGGAMAGQSEELHDSASHDATNVDSDATISPSSPFLDSLMILVVAIKAIHATQFSEKCRNLTVIVREVLFSMLPIAGLIAVTTFTFASMNYATER